MAEAAARRTREADAADAARARLEAVMVWGWRGDGQIDGELSSITTQHNNNTK